MEREDERTCTHRPSAAAWLRQARYDLEVARLLLGDERPAYAVFFAHLALEKALKGCYRHVHGRPPPVSHNLRHLAAQSGLPLVEAQRSFLQKINPASILNLYPDRPFAADVSYDKAAAQHVLDTAQSLLDWTGEQHDDFR